MSKQRDRDEFIALMAQEGVSVNDARKLLRYAATLHRLAELECSSEAADRDRVPCPRANKPAWEGWRVEVIPCLCRDYGSYDGDHGTVPRIAVHEARTRRRVETLCATFPAKHVVTSGDRTVGVFDSPEQAAQWIIQSPRDEYFSTYRPSKRGIVPVFQGDPRGAVLKLQVPSGKTNDWGRTGICVPH